MKYGCRPGDSSWLRGRTSSAGFSGGWQLFLLATLVGCGLLSPDAEHPTELPIERSALRAHLEFLADDSLYGRLAGSAYERHAAEYVRDRFRSYGLDPGASDYFQTFPVGPDPREVDDAGVGRGTGVTATEDDVPFSQNVLASLPGQGGLAGEWVILGAHYDHLGFESSGDSIVIFNGANDNASGTSLLLEAARILSEFAAQGTGGDRRSIMFQAYGAEEAGLLGSFHFVGNPSIPLASIVAMVNLDMVGRLRDGLLMVRSPGAPWRSMLAGLNDGSLQLVSEAGPVDRSDQYPFLLRGIPVLHFYTGDHAEYHTAFDDVASLNLAGMEKIGRLTVGLLWELAVQPNLTELHRVPVEIH